MSNINFVDTVLTQLNQKLQDEPYQINLLEEVHMHDKEEKHELNGLKKKVCENAHTRILRRILEYKNGKEYILFKSLLDTIADKCPGWKGLSKLVEKPEFEPEASCNYSYGRIDLLIKEDRKYAIIIENKINEAIDQKSQLGRYIAHMQNEDFLPNQIFVLYLSSESDEPNPNSWSYSGKNYSQDYKERYCNFSFRYSILPWLENIVLPIEGRFPKQKYLISATEQYVDYLKGRFGLRVKEGEFIDEILNNILKKEQDLNKRMRLLDDAREQIEPKIIQSRKDAEDIPAEYITLCERLYKEIKRTLQGQINENRHTVYNRHAIRGRKVYLGYEYTIGNQDVIAYIGRATSGYLACSVITRSGEDLSNEVLARIPYLSAGGNDYRYSRHTQNKKDDFSSAVKKLQKVLESLDEKEESTGLH